MGAYVAILGLILGFLGIVVLACLGAAVVYLISLAIAVRRDK